MPQPCAATTVHAKDSLVKTLPNREAFLTETVFDLSENSESRTRIEKIESGIGGAEPTGRGGPDEKRTPFDRIHRLLGQG